MKNLIKLWLITVSSVTWAANFYRVGYFDQSQPAALKLEVINDWFRKGLRSAGVKSETRIQVVPVKETSLDEELKGLDLLLLRADLAEAQKIAKRFYELGGRLFVSDKWNRVDLGLEKAAVFSVGIAHENRQQPLAAWLQEFEKNTNKVGTYFQRADSDFDKIWFFDFLKLSETKNWKWSEFLVQAKPDLTKFKDHSKFGNVLLASRIDQKLLDLLSGAEISASIVFAEDLNSFGANLSTEAFFAKKHSVYMLSEYPKGLTDEARDFEKKYKEATASSDALLHDAVVLTAKALGTSMMRVDSVSKFFASLDKQRFKGATGEIRIQKGRLLREAFVIYQRGDERTLVWRSGVLK